MFKTPIFARKSKMIFFNQLRCFNHFKAEVITTSQLDKPTKIMNRFLFLTSNTLTTVNLPERMCDNCQLTKANV